MVDVGDKKIDGSPGAEGGDGRAARGLASARTVALGEDTIVAVSTARVRGRSGSSDLAALMPSAIAGDGLSTRGRVSRL